MACLGAVLYDPAAAATKSAAAALAMTALDTTNARITFTAPANGTVLVKLRAASKGAATTAQILLGILDGSTVRGRQVPIQRQQSSTSAYLRPSECTFIVTGLTPGNSYTWDAAYGVETGVASYVIGWGGPNDTTASNAYGALEFSIWETTNLLAGVHYDPATAVSEAASALLAMTAFDTTNLRLSFTVPASGNVLVRLRCPGAGVTLASTGIVHLGVLNGATVVARQAALGWITQSGSVSATDFCGFHAEFVVPGLTPGANLTWDAAYGVETVQATQTLNYGGPDNATANDAWGGLAYEVWAA
jgi:hypothetical protein